MIAVLEVGIFVRMLLPPIVLRRQMDRNLADFFHGDRQALFRRAISDFCRFYGMKRPKIEWYEYIDWGKTAGKTFEDGRIHLVHPENWKRGRVYKSERMWVQTVYHELAHYLFWTDAERKAEAFMHRMVRGLRQISRRGRSVAGAQRAGSSRTVAARSGIRRARVGRAAALPIRGRRTKRSAAAKREYRRGNARAARA
jgi:hypothetical protein